MPRRNLNFPFFADSDRISTLIVRVMHSCFGPECGHNGFGCIYFCLCFITSYVILQKCVSWSVMAKVLVLNLLLASWNRADSRRQLMSSPHLWSLVVDGSVLEEGSGLCSWEGCLYDSSLVSFCSMGEAWQRGVRLEHALSLTACLSGAFQHITEKQKQAHRDISICHTTPCNNYSIRFALSG